MNPILPAEEYDTVGNHAEPIKDNATWNIYSYLLSTVTTWEVWEYDYWSL